MKTVSFYIWDKQTGAIIRSGLDEADTPELRQVPDGQVFVETSDPIPTPGRDKVSPSGQVIYSVDAPPKPATAVLPQPEFTANRIVKGFQSNALGETYTYPSAVLDQTNLLQAAQVGGKLMCADKGGKWALVDHTADQAKKVLADFVRMKDIIRVKIAAVG